MSTEKTGMQGLGALEPEQEPALWRRFQAALPWLTALALLLVMVPAFGIAGGLLPYALLGLAVLAVAVSAHPLAAFSLYFLTLSYADTTLPGVGVSANQVLAPLFFISFLSCWARGKALRLESKLLPVLVLVTIYFALSAAFGESREGGLLHLRYVLAYFAVAICLAKSLSSEKAILALAWIVVGTTFLAACAGFAEAVEKNVLGAFAGKWTNAVRIQGTAKNSVVFGWNMLFAVPFAFLLYGENRTPFFRNLALALALAVIAAATLTFNRQVYVVIALSVGLAAVLFRFPNRRVLLLGVAALAVLGSVTVFPMILKRLLTVAEIGKDVSFLERRDSFLMGAQMFRENPLFGVGFGSYPYVWKQYIPEGIPTFFVQYQEATRKRYPDFGYMALLAETGITGFSMFLFLLGFTARQAWRLRREALHRGLLFPANFASMILVLVLHVGATSAIQDTFLYTRVWVLHGVALLCDLRIWQLADERRPPA